MEKMIVFYCLGSFLTFISLLIHKRFYNKEVSDVETVLLWWYFFPELIADFLTLVKDHFETRRQVKLRVREIFKICDNPDAKNWNKEQWKAWNEDTNLKVQNWSEKDWQHFNSSCNGNKI